MAISNYSELQTAIKRWIIEEDYAEYVPDFIALAESRIYNDHECKIRGLETEFNEIIIDGKLPIPLDYTRIEAFYVDVNPIRRLHVQSAGWIYQNYPERSGIPQFIARERDNFIFGPKADSDYTVKGTYFSRLAPLSDTNETNQILTAAPDLFLFASLVEAELFMKDDERATMWEQRYEQAKARVTASYNNETVAGAPLVMTAG